MIRGERTVQKGGIWVLVVFAVVQVRSMDGEAGFLCFEIPCVYLLLLHGCAIWMLGLYGDM